MSVLHHEEILETCFYDAYESFRIDNNYSISEMEDLCIQNKNLRKRLEEVAIQLFEDRCQ